MRRPAATCGAPKQHTRHVVPAQLDPCALCMHERPLLQHGPTLPAATSQVGGASPRRSKRLQTPVKPPSPHPSGAPHANTGSAQGARDGGRSRKSRIGPAWSAPIQHAVHAEALRGVTARSGRRSCGRRTAPAHSDPEHAPHAAALRGVTARSRRRSCGSRTALPILPPQACAACASHAGRHSSQ